MELMSNICNAGISCQELFQKAVTSYDMFVSLIQDMGRTLAV